MSRYIDADLLKDKTTRVNNIWNGTTNAEGKGLDEIIDDIPTADVRDDATAHKVVGGGERYGATCWFECDCCGLAVDVGDVFCKHCGARFVP